MLTVSSFDCNAVGHKRNECPSLKQGACFGVIKNNNNNNKGAAMQLINQTEPLCEEKLN